MFVLRKFLGALLGVVAVATLVGVVLPAGPAAAEPECRWTPTPKIDCLPMRPLVPPPMGNPDMRMLPQPGGPVAQPGETCRSAQARDGIFIREAGLPDKLIYTLIVTFDYCHTDNDGDEVNTGIVTRATVTSRTERAVPGDSRLRTISPTSTATTNIPGGNRFTNVQQVFFTVCGDPFNTASCRNFRHSVQVQVTGDNILSGFGRLEVFNGTLPPGGT